MKTDKYKEALLEQEEYEKKVNVMKDEIKLMIFGKGGDMCDGILAEHFFGNRVYMESGDCDPHLHFKLSDLIDELSDCLADLIVGNDGYLK